MSEQEKNEPDQGQDDDQDKDQEQELEQDKSDEQQQLQQQQIDKEKEQENASEAAKELVILNRIYMGEFENLPSLASKLVRIFTSSTFTDTQVERNMLMENIYPKLKEYCRERGLEFQVVDMRWGVRDESTDDHKTADLCMNEIDNCQRLSLGPNFVVFLCQKYGYRPLPTRVLDTEFHMITNILEEESAQLLTKWYKLDTNSVPNLYVLQPVSSIYVNFTNKAQKQLMEQDQALWWKTMAQLCTIIRLGSARLVEAKKFTHEDNHRYNYSVTEQEVIRGILTSKDNTEHTVAFIRQINNINIKLFQHSAKFIDINFAQRKIDDEAQQLLSELRDVKVPSKLDAASIIHYDIEWSDNEGINKVDHANYLIEFGNMFYTRIVNLIERAISRQMKLAQNKMFSELLQHLRFCTSSTKLFKGRHEILDQLKSYVKNVERNQPFAMDGPSGCGKSSIIAKTALLIRNWMDIKCTPVIIIRFLGTTPDSSSIYPLIKSICQQISHIYEKSVDAIPIELSNLTNYFKKLLECATPEKPLFIFLDSLDSLSAMNSAHSLSWMPVNLPKNVKIVVSTLSGYYGITQTLHNMIEIPENFAKVEPLGEELAIDVLYEMLGNIHRTISERQLLIVREALSTCNSPLYVKLVFDQICLWKSYTMDNNIAKSIEVCIEKLFERVENAHGKVLVKYALSYVTASKNGLSEAELEDLISIDETVLNDIYQYHLPPIRRIPPLLWTRIRNDIASYLTEREADGVSVVNWYHRQFIQVSMKRYLSNDDFKVYIHSQISDYFLGIWANVPKPYTYTEEQKRMFLLKSLHGEADRKVPPQPEMFVNSNDPNASVRYNGRKLSELPFNLLRSNRIEELFNKALFHYKFLYAKLSCMPLNSLIADFEDFLNNNKFNKEVALVTDTLRLSSSILSVSATNLVPQIVGRLLPYTYIQSKKFDNIRALIGECESDGLQNSAFVPAFNCFHVPGGPLVYSLEAHPFAVYGVSLMADDTQLLSVSNKFIIFDLSSGDVVRVINPQLEGILQSLSVSPDKKYCVSYSNNDQIVVCNIISGDCKISNRYVIPTPPKETHTGEDHTDQSNKGQSQSRVPGKNSIQNQQQSRVQKPNLNTKQPNNHNNTFVNKNITNNNSKMVNGKVTVPPGNKPANIQAEPVKPLENVSFIDQLTGSNSGLNYFVIWSKYYYYIYDKKGRIIKGEKCVKPLIQIEIIENKSIEMYGIELEVVGRAEDCRDDEEKERDNLVLEYKFILDPFKLPTQHKASKKDDKKNSTPVLTETDINKMYHPSCSTVIEIHSCMVLTKNKKKLFACTEIGDNVVECFRNRIQYYYEKTTEEPNDSKSIKLSKNIWKFHRSLDDNLEKISSLTLSEDESYMLATVVWGFKVFFLLTGQSKPLKLPKGVKNIQIGQKKLSFPALFSKENKFVVAGVRDNIYIWETSYGTYIKQLDAHYGRITWCLGSFKDQKNLVLSSSMDKTIKIWNLNNVMEEDFPLDHLEKPIEKIHVSTSNSIAMCQSRNQLAVYNLKDGRIKFQLCHSPHGAIFNCSQLSTTGLLAASSESNRLVIWDVEERKPTYVCPSQNNQIHIKQLEFHQSEMYVLCATFDTRSNLVNISSYTISDGDVTYKIEYNCKQGTEYKNFLITSDEMYLVVYRNDKKNDSLAIHTAMDGAFLHNVKLAYMNYKEDFISMIPMYKSPHLIAIIDSDKGNLINVRDKKFIRSVPKWNGRATKDDKHGLYAPSRGGLELLDLKSTKQVKIFIPKIAEGVFDVDTLITPNDKHIIYYHSGRRTIRVFRLEDGKKIADYKSTAKVRCMVATQDSKSVLIGCEDGTMSMFIIADPYYSDYVEYLREWRTDQLNLYSREAAPSPTPMVDSSQANSAALFKGVNVLAQKFDVNGNTDDLLSNDQNPLQKTDDKNDTDNQDNGEQESSMTIIGAKIAPSAEDDQKES